MNWYEDVGFGPTCCWIWVVLRLIQSRTSCYVSSQILREQHRKKMELHMLKRRRLICSPCEHIEGIPLTVAPSTTCLKSGGGVEADVGPAGGPEDCWEQQSGRERKTPASGPDRPKCLDQGLLQQQHTCGPTPVDTVRFETLGSMLHLPRNGSKSWTKQDQSSRAFSFPFVLRY